MHHGKKTLYRCKTDPPAYENEISMMCWWLGDKMFCFHAVGPNSVPGMRISFTRLVVRMPGSALGDSESIPGVSTRRLSSQLAGFVSQDGLSTRH